jgi:UDP-2,3-diacylglucosamine pyrophosphatase LpxH
MPTERTRRIFISDIHLSSEQAYRPENSQPLSWFLPERDGERLLNFLEASIILNGADIKDVVLLGDIFNSWVWPADQAPPGYDRIFESNPLVLEKLAKIIAGGINLFFINGNHDFDLSPDQLQAAIPGIQPVQCYRSGLMFAEHGHQYDIYNKPDFICDPAHGRPIGYFITRLMTSAGQVQFNLLDLPGVIDDILEAALTSQTIFASIIEALAERAGMKGEDEVLLPGGDRISINQLKERYQKLGEIYNLSELISDLYERRYLHGPADRLCQKNDYHVVVFGHTHNALIDKDFFLVKDRIYANSGCFCKENAYCVEIDKVNDSKKPIKVRLNQVESHGGMSLIEEQEVRVEEKKKRMASSITRRPKRRRR